MKNDRLISAIVAFCILSSIGWSQNVIELKYSTYTLTAFSQPFSEEGLKAAPFISARQRIASGKELRPFGIVYEGKAESPDAQTIFEIIDAEKNASIKKISVGEYYGKETAGWKSIAAESKISPDKLLSVFRIQVGAYNIKLTREIAVAEERNLPLGKKIAVAFSVESDIPLKLKGKFFGVAEGSWKSAGKSFFISESDSLSSIHPTLIFHPLQGSAVDAGSSSGKNSPRRFTITSKEISVPRNTQTIIFSLEAIGTTIFFKEHIARQAENLKTYLDTHTGKPAVVAVSQASKAMTRPGDTLTFFLYSHNIGTAAAVENTLSNIIPAGTLYIEGSAEGTASTITLTRKEAVLPQVGQVTNITWKFTDPIYPGEERKASFKVIIQ
jgi:uncharacterized repeat protein (TIGR01451 family)